MFQRYRDLPGRVLVLCLGAFVNRAGGMVMPFLALYLTSARGYPTETASTILALFGLGSVCASLLGGHLADRIGRRPVMIASLVGAAVTLQLVPHAPSEGLVMLAVFVFALAGEAYRPAASAMLGDLTAPEDRPRAYALFYVAVNLGFTVGAAAGGALAAYSYDLLFVVEAAGALGYAAITALFLAETRPVEAARAELPGGALGHVLSNRPFVIFVLANLLIGVMFNQAFTTLPLSLHAAGFSTETYGRVMAVNGVLIVACQLPIASALATRDRGRYLVIGTLLLALGFGLTGAFEAALPIAGCIALWTVGEMIIASLGNPTVNDLAPPELRARYFGVFSLSFGLAMSVGPLLGGWLFEHLGARLMWLCVAGLGLTAAAMQASIRRRLSAPSPPPDSGTARSPRASSAAAPAPAESRPLES